MSQQHAAEDSVSYLTIDKGVSKRVLAAGHGPEVQPGSIVTVKYTGYLEDDTVFDDSERHGGSFQIVAAANHVIPGLDLGVQSMREGETASFTFSWNYAFGTIGCPPLVPPSCNVRYDVTVVSVTAGQPAYGATTVAELLEQVSSLRAEGNSHVKTEPDNAILCYNRAIGAVERARVTITTESVDGGAKRAIFTMAGRPLSPEDASALAQSLVFCYLNLALCQLSQSNPSKAISAAERAAQLDPTNPKCYYRWGCGLLALNDAAGALEKLRQAARLSPSDAAIRAKLNEAEAIRRKQQEETQKRFAQAWSRDR